MTEILVTAKIGPDLDGLSCTYAFAHLLNAQGGNAVGGVFGEPHVEAKYIIERFGIGDLVYDPPGPFAEFILVDASDLADMPTVIKPEKVIEVIDHREIYNPAQNFPQAKIQIEKVGAAATLIAERYLQAKVPVDRNSALLLYGAVFSNTLNFKAKVTTHRDHEAVEFLKTQTDIPGDLVRGMFEAKTKDVFSRLSEAIEEEGKNFIRGSINYSIVQLEVLNAVKLVEENKYLIVNDLQELMRSQSLNFNFLSAIDLEKGFNIFVAPSSESQNILQKVLGLKFKGVVAKSEGLILRKELVPLIKQALVV